MNQRLTNAPVRRCDYETKAQGKRGSRMRLCCRVVNIQHDVRIAEIGIV